MLIIFRQAPSYPNTKSRTRNKWQSSIQMHGSRTNSRRRRPDPAPFVAKPITKKSFSFAMHAMPHTIHIALVSIGFLPDTGFAWNVQKMEHMPDLQTLQMPPHARNHCLADWHLEHKPNSDEIGRELGVIIGMEPGVSSAAESTMLQDWILTFPTTINL